MSDNAVFRVSNHDEVVGPEPVANRRDAERTRVTYLIGAGATHACNALLNGEGLLMRDLVPGVLRRLSERLRAVEYEPLHPFLNQLLEVEDKPIDIEHVISHLASTPTDLHQRAAEQLRECFLAELNKKLEAHGNLATGHFESYSLYKALLEFHNLNEEQEELVGILTLNYDDLIEQAVKAVYGNRPSLGISTSGSASIAATATSVTLVKLHGSLDWTSGWPIGIGKSDTPTWIAPGVYKDKTKYPFQSLWGKGRELLDCNVLRIVGCRLSLNDWDLLSMIFSTHLAVNESGPHRYRIELIDAPTTAEELQALHPLFAITSIFDLDLVGEMIKEEASAFVEKLKGDRAPDYESEPNHLDHSFALGHKCQGSSDELGPESASLNWFASWLGAWRRVINSKDPSALANAPSLAKLEEVDL